VGGVAIIYQATLVPTKIELIAAWLPTRPWLDGPVGVVHPVGAYRFDDPAGEVGIESHLLEVGGRLVHVPLTYRGAELPGAREWLVGTTEHSVLGTRWVYDAEGDPVYRDEVARVIREAGTQVRMLVQTPQGPVEREPTVLVRGSGTDGSRRTGAGAESRVVVVRLPAVGFDAPTSGTLTGTWPGQDEPVVLAHLG
jgi:hypothetical protein